MPPENRTWTAAGALAITLPAPSRDILGRVRRVLTGRDEWGRRREMRSERGRTGVGGASKGGGLADDHIASSLEWLLARRGTTFSVIPHPPRLSKPSAPSDAADLETMVFLLTRIVGASRLYTSRRSLTIHAPSPGQVRSTARRSNIDDKLAQLHPQLAKLTRQYLFLRPPWLVQPPPTSFDPAMDLRRLGRPKTPEERGERAAVKLWRKKEERARVLKFREAWQRRALKERQRAMEEQKRRVDSAMESKVKLARLRLAAVLTAPDDVSDINHAALVLPADILPDEPLAMIPHPPRPQ
ncbi:hypothetical protein NBRC10512_008240 [Rhodotorula toruloides]|uniref:Uncharacterized protein n=1 Tax=Rhodotorula toruloides (strain NP11) TaxID=1130832 RepID=M7WKC8_RHOT1|nr:uncharacterized protein RHTO_02242 [Rhodotorula toruloides NP11]EMS20952.1 hypothetical protein RHTO_02242 [Rhodotorula toruloides NP11]